MKLSVVMTINNRTPEVCQKVADSFRLPGNQPDEMIIVLDRPSQDVREGVMKAYHDMPFRVVYTTIEGKPGWLGPAKAWNIGFKHALGEILYCISSEVIQDEGNVEKALSLVESSNTVLFGACHNSIATALVVGAEPGLLVSSEMNRPLGFIVCMPADRVREIGGFDEEFMHGFWYDDDDFFIRMWNTGLDFVFDDSIHGVHIDHERKELNTIEGQMGISTNRRLIIKKYGKDNLWHGLDKTVTNTKGRSVWRHP